MNEQYGRVAIVTGATSGIGDATARLFVASGFGIVGSGRNAVRLKDLDGELGWSVKDADLGEFREVFEINVQGALLLM